MILIAALGNDRVIGSGDGMPWDVPEEYEHFLSLIEGQSVLMGRRSWEIFGGDLTSAHNIVISRSVRRLMGAKVAHSLGEAMELGRSYGKTLFCAGGAGVYAQALPHADAMYLSFIKGEFSGDAYFPQYDDADWIIDMRVDHPRFEYVVFRRQAAA
ncbi:MAG: hypothetical protein GTN89_10825 [Acidobacteria bacterium]|nr:hypothetical protein [Acidobacteriota bacterium]NIM63823.1 hypothetical protein [Acidobacteriota bacterium]NIO59757.1 hypothetical protein [Acidobacteriota bacterium]NIQ30840.1 hypothetical protein [Acidobacteriota bacterium]NIQ85913.1 hypothetical protein [Acidobacteriota bacterium]